jgi:ribonuclease HII
LCVGSFFPVDSVCIDSFFMRCVGMPDFSHELRLGRNGGRKDGRTVCGVDEAGRGPLAGPVVAAAILLPRRVPKAIRDEIRDSKKLTAAQRDALFVPLMSLCPFAIAEATVAEIDTLNILQATMLAMQRAVSELHALSPVEVALIDGNRAPALHCPAECVIGGDDKSLSIAAASILAKVHRDRLMHRLAATHPFYGWERNAGYGTREHMDAMKKHGVTVWHRASFAPVRDILDGALIGTAA